MLFRSLFEGYTTKLSSSYEETLQDGFVMVSQRLQYGLHGSVGNTVDTALLTLNGHDRFSAQDGTYFNSVQPYQYFENTPADGINVYSFALNPGEHQPSGTCNFSRIDNATLQLVVSAAAVASSATAKVRVYATNYNVLRIMSGMGGLAYSN